MSSFGIYPLFNINSAWPNWVIITLLLQSISSSASLRSDGFRTTAGRRWHSGWLLAIFLIPYVGVSAFLLLGSAKLPKRRRDKQMLSQ